MEIVPAKGFGAVIASRRRVERLGVIWLVIGVGAVAMVAGLRLFRKRPPDPSDLGELSGEWVAEHLSHPDDSFL